MKNMLKRFRGAFLPQPKGDTPSTPKASSALRSGAQTCGAQKNRFGFQVVQKRTVSEQKHIVQTLFNEEINPQVASHSGKFTLLDVRDNLVYLRVEGRCQGCSMVSVTLGQAVEQRLREVLPEIIDVVDETDHSAGTNPYFTPGKK